MCSFILLFLAHANDSTFIQKQSTPIHKPTLYAYSAFLVNWFFAWLLTHKALNMWTNNGGTESVVPFRILAFPNQPCHWPPNHRRRKYLHLYLYFPHTPAFALCSCCLNLSCGYKSSLSKGFPNGAYCGTKIATKFHLKENVRESWRVENSFVG